MNRVKELTCGWIVDADLSFSTPSNKFLQRIFRLHDAELAQQVPWGKDTIRHNVCDLFTTKRQVIQSEFNSALSRIHLSFDLWTSPNNIAFLGVNAHFINKNFTSQNRLIGLRRQRGVHSGENIAANLEALLKSWGLSSQVGVFVTDNASNNDKCLEFLYPKLNDRMTLRDVKEHRLRCYGHILNLVAHHFLLGEDADAFQREVLVNELLQQDEKNFKLWRKQGPVGKLHNIVRFVRASPQRSELMREIAREDLEETFFLSEESTAELELIQNNNTRWNSTYLMIRRAIKKQDDIERFIRYLDMEDPASSIPREDRLTLGDWKVLSEIATILEPIYHQTM